MPSMPDLRFSKFVKSDRMHRMKALEFATQIVKKLRDAGYTAYFAGGWVRDYLMEHPSSDVDIATDATPEIIQEMFPRTLAIGAAFGVIIVLHNGHQFEVSTFRRDIEYVGGRKPTRIEHCDAEEDASRRDFTINGMFYDPLTEEVIDYVGGIKDLKKGIIKTIGDPFERFFEDRLRMVRAIRFSARFGFPIDKKTQEAIKENAPTLFPAVAVERIWQEFVKMSEHPQFDQAVIEMHRMELLPVIFPQLEGVHLTEIKKRVAAFPFFPKEIPTILFVMELFPDEALERLLDLCLYLKISTRNARLVEFAYESRKLLVRKGVAQAEWTHFYAHPQAQYCLDIAAAHYKGEEHMQFLKEHGERMELLHPHSQRVVEGKPLVPGRLLKELGVPPGKIMGGLMKEAEYLAITHDIHTPEEVLELLKKSPNWPKTLAN